MSMDRFVQPHKQKRLVTGVAMSFDRPFFPVEESIAMNLFANEQTVCEPTQSDLSLGMAHRTPHAFPPAMVNPAINSTSVTPYGQTSAVKGS
jgi:hypothetical protein